jgi:hypothetical protein
LVLPWAIAHEVEAKGWGEICEDQMSRKETRLVLLHSPASEFEGMVVEDLIARSMSFARGEQYKEKSKLAESVSDAAQLPFCK